MEERAPKTARVLAVDPGYDRIGFAVLEKRMGQSREQVLYSNCFTTNKEDPFPTRLVYVGNKFLRLIQSYAPDRVALEKLYVAVNQKTAMAVSEVRGVLIYLATAEEIPLIEYTPLEVKSAITSDGHADKRQVMAMVPKLVELKDTPRYDDEYDAIAVGITALARWAEYPST